MTNSKIRKTIVCIVAAMFAIVPFFGFAKTNSAFAAGERTFRVANWEDYIYIDEDSDNRSMVDDFKDYYKEKTGETIKIEYTTFGTPEDLYNNLKIDANAYDVMSPSDYMIEKMAREGMLQKINLPEDGEYKTNVSPYIEKIFDGIKWQENGAQVSLSDYAAGYMWGTLGLVYNSEKVSDADMLSWEALWSGKFDKKFSIKDSVRDTYFMTLAKVYKDELKALDPTQADYNAKLTEIFNRTDADTVEKVKTEMSDLKKRSYGMEVDSGKNDIVTGKIDVYFAWSGDAVYAMDAAEEGSNPVYLNYSVPEEGSNVWFDGWCVPKGSQNADIAVAFIEYLSKPENAIKNMDYIGYVSCIAGEDVFNRAVEEYDEEEGSPVDLSYFFRREGDTNEYIIRSSSKVRQFAAQYPSEEVIKRCAVMSYFDDTANERINTLWMDIKGGSGCGSALATDAGLLVLLLALGVCVSVKSVIKIKK